MEIVVVTCQPVFGFGLEFLIRSGFPGACIHKVYDGENLVARCLDLLPDLVVLDVPAFCSDWRPMVQQLRVLQPAIRTLVLTAKNAEAFTWGNPGSGIWGNIDRNCNGDAFLDAMTSVLTREKSYTAGYLTTGI